MLARTLVAHIFFLGVRLHVICSNCDEELVPEENRREKQNRKPVADDPSKAALHEPMQAGMLGALH
jgi:hypothetical protein